MHKPIFSTMMQAMLALANDRLGTIYKDDRKVFIATSYGTATFMRKAWESFEAGINEQAKNYNSQS